MTDRRVGSPLTLEQQAEALTVEALPKVMTAVKAARDRHWEALEALGEQRSGKVAKWSGEASDALMDAIYGAVQSTTWIALYSLIARESSSQHEIERITKERDELAVAFASTSIMADKTGALLAAAHGRAEAAEAEITRLQAQRTQAQQDT